MEPITLQDGTSLDPKVVKVMRAIRSVETGGDFNAIGDNGESHGAYQWHNDNWKNAAKEILGDENAPMSPENQNKVAYGQIKAYKDAGRTPEEIAALWNGAHKDKSTGLYTYNAPEYGVKFRKAIQEQQTGGSSQPDANGYNTTPAFTNPPATGGDSSQEETLGGDLKNRASQASKALTDTATGQINPLSGILQTVGAGAGAVGDTVNAGLKLIPGVKQVEGLIGKGIGKLANTGAGKAVVGGINNFSTAHPELSGDIGAIGNIAGVAGLATGAGAAKEAIGGAIGKALGKDALSATIDSISPEIKAGTKAGASNVIKKGTTKSLISGAIQRVEDPELREAAQVIHDNVPNFDKLGTDAERLNALKDEALPNEANALREKFRAEGVQPVVTPEAYDKFLSSIKTAIEESPSLVGDSGEYAKRLLAQFQKELPQTGDITMENVLDARQALDRAALKYKPTAFDKQGAFNDGLTAVRDSANNLLDESAPNAEVKASLRRQRLLYKAIKNIGPKADREVGTTRFSRFTAKYPKTTGLIKTAAKKGAEGLVGYEVIKKASQ